MPRPLVAPYILLFFLSPLILAEILWFCPSEQCLRPTAEVYNVLEATDLECFHPPPLFPGHVCALERQLCACHGHVLMGDGQVYTKPILVNGTVLCDNDFFCGDPVPGYSKHCICQPLDALGTSIDDSDAPPIAAPTMSCGKCPNYNRAECCGRVDPRMHRGGGMSPCVPAPNGTVFLGLAGLDENECEPLCVVNGTCLVEGDAHHAQNPVWATCPPDSEAGSTTATPGDIEPLPGSHVMTWNTTTGESVKHAIAAAGYNIDSEVSCVGSSLTVDGSVAAIAFAEEGFVRGIAGLALSSCLGMVTVTGYQVNVTSARIDVDFVVVGDRLRTFRRLAVAASSCFQARLEAVADSVGDQFVTSLINQLNFRIHAPNISVEVGTTSTQPEPPEADSTLIGCEPPSLALIWVIFFIFESYQLTIR